MWNEFVKENFIYVEREKVIIYPDCELNGKMICLIHISHCSRWAPNEEIDIMADFIQYCARKLHASKRTMYFGRYEMWRTPSGKFGRALSGVCGRDVFRCSGFEHTKYGWTG